MKTSGYVFREYLAMTVKGGSRQDREEPSCTVHCLV